MCVVGIDGSVGENACRISVQMWSDCGVIWDTACQINGNKMRPPKEKIQG